jgi:hypothetical protein
MKITTKLVATAALTLTLAGCSGQPQQTAQESPSNSPTNSASVSATPTNTATPKPSKGPSVTPTPEASKTLVPAPAPVRKSALEMSPEEAMNAAKNGEITLDEYCQRDSFLTSGDTQMCDFHNNPEANTPTEPTGAFNYDQAYAAWQNGMPYYEAFCERYTPVTSGGVNQCNMISAGTVDYYTGEYIGDQGLAPMPVPSFPPADGGDPYCNKDAQGNMHCVTPVPDFLQ